MKTLIHVAGSTKFRENTDKMIKSLKAFHPEAQILRVNEDVCNKNFELPTVKRWPFYPALIFPLFAYCDRVIHIDSDVVVCDTMHELFMEDYDVAGGLDNRPDYINLGIFSITKDFTMAWIKELETGVGKQNELDQDTFNRVFWSGKYKAKVLDAEGTGVIYGTEAFHHHADMKVVDNRIMLYDKKVRALHIATPFYDQTPAKWFNFDGFVDPTVKFQLNLFLEGHV